MAMKKRSKQHLSAKNGLKKNGLMLALRAMQRERGTVAMFFSL